MTAIATGYGSLLKVRKGAVAIVDVPEFGFVADLPVMDLCHDDPTRWSRR